MFGALIGGIVSGLVSVIPGLAQVIGNTVVAKSNTEAARQGNENATGSSLALAWLTSVEEANKLKIASRTERTVMFGLMAFAAPCALIFWAACLDSIPFYLPIFMSTAHKVGSWRVGVPPELLADFHLIVQSFFIAAPAVAGASLLARAFRH